MKPRKGQLIKFKAMDDFTGEEMELSGIVVGDWKKIKKNYPTEQGGVDENSDVFLVKAVHWAGNHIVHISEIIKKKEKE
jgi:hypothetical protein